MRRAIVLMAAVLIGCDAPQQAPVVETNFGTIVSSRVIQGDWSTPVRTEITTTKGTFSVVSTGPVENGKRVFVVRQGREVYYDIENLGRCYPFAK